MIGLSIDSQFLKKDQTMSVISKLFGKTTRIVSTTPRRTVRLGLEQLDARLVPSTVATGPDGTTYAIYNSDHELWAYHHGQTWEQDWWENLQINNVHSVAVSRTGVVDVLTNYNDVYQRTGGVGSSFNKLINGGSIGEIAAGYGTDVYCTWFGDRELWQLDASHIWHYQNISNVMNIGADGSAIVDFNGALKVNMGNFNWQLVTYGAHAVASDSYHGEILFTWGSDYELWGAYGSNYQSFDNYHMNNIAQISCYANYGGSYLQQFDTISMNGAVSTHSNWSGWGLDSGITAWTY